MGRLSTVKRTVLALATLATVSKQYFYRFLIYVQKGRVGRIDMKEEMEKKLNFHLFIG